MGVRGPHKVPCGVQGQHPRWRSEGEVSWNWRFFFLLNLRYENPVSWHLIQSQTLYPVSSPLTLHFVSNSHSQNTIYCALRVSSRGTNNATPLVGVRGQSPLKLKAILKSKARTPPPPPKKKTQKNKTKTKQKQKQNKTKQKQNNQKTNKPFPGTLSHFKQSITKYNILCFKAIFQRTKPGLDKGQYPKTLHP